MLVFVEGKDIKPQNLFFGWQTIFFWLVAAEIF